MRFLFLFQILFFSVLISHSQLSNGSRSYGMAGATAALTGRGLMLGNPATEKVNELIFSVGRPPGISGLDQIAFAAHGQVKSVSLETGVQRFGNDLASMDLLYAGIAHRIGSTVLGYRINLDQFRAEQISSISNFSFSLGGITKLSQAIAVGAYMDRIIISSASMKEKMMPVRFTAGLAFELSPNLTSGISVSQKINGFPALRSGLEYRITPSVDLRLGNSFYPSGFFFGTSIKYWNLTADLAGSYRQHEGLMIQATACYRYHRKKS